ncbi:hypothetical protein ACGFYU_10435 [Streptomyces sp. NPDC048337]|uniref:hypothetical protein n=1 Tax=Streptomyces sp. NPDC048337 TaxID=3365535 RepID=UPI00371CE10C
MPRHHPAPWPRALLACLLSGLLLAAVHCSSFLSGDTHGHLSLGTPAAASAADHHQQQHAPARPRHDHSAACTFPGLAAQAAHGQVPYPAGPVLAPLPVLNAGRPTAETPSPAPGSHRTHIARPGRTTLADVCRWRI